MRRVAVHRNAARETTRDRGRAHLDGADLRRGEGRETPSLGCECDVHSDNVRQQDVTGGSGPPTKHAGAVHDD